MTFILEVPNDLERELEKAAARAGLSVTDYALRVLAGIDPHVSESNPPRTGAELVAYWKREALIGTRPEISDPAKYARDLRERAQRRRGG